MARLGRGGPEAHAPVIPVAPIAFILVRLLMSGRAGEASSMNVSAPPFRLLTIPLTLFVLPAALVNPEPAALVVAVSLALFSFPQPLLYGIARWAPPGIAVRLMPLIATRHMTADTRAASILGVVRARGLRPDQVERLLTRLDETPEVTPYACVARAALLASRGDMGEARWRMELVARLPVVARLHHGRRLAQEWLIAAAAAEGDHELATALASGEAWGVSAAVRALTPITHAAEWGEPPPRHEALRQLWYGRPLLFWACRATPPSGDGPGTTPTPPQPSGAPTPLAVAAEACARWSAQPGVHPPLLRNAAAALDALAADPTLRGDVSTRAAALGVRGADPLDAWVQRQTEAFTTRMVRDRRLPDAGGSPSLQAAVRDATETLWAELRDQLAELRRTAIPRAAEGAFTGSFMERRRHIERLAVQGRLDADADWHRLGAIMRLSETLATDVDERRMVFALVCNPLLNFAVDAFNQRRQRYFGHIVFHWLLDLGRGVGHDETMKLLRKNAGVSR